jgi:TIR domain-containing protein
MSQRAASLARRRNRRSVWFLTGSRANFTLRPMPHDVFISYSTNDKVTADAACARLEAAGIRCWIAPRDITPGKQWGEAIIDAINQCRAIVLIFSESANRSPQIHREVERAVNKGLPVLPMRIENIEPDRSLEYFIGAVHWLDAMTPPLEAHLRRLIEAVTALLQIDDVPRPTPIPPPPPPPNRLIPVIVALSLVAVAAIAIAGWLLLGRQQVASAPQPPAPAQAKPAVESQPAEATVKSVAPPPAAPATVDPAVVGTLEHSAVIDDYEWLFIDVIGADGSFHLVMTEEEDGVLQAANGRYRTLATKSGRVRTGTYRAIAGTGIEVTGAAGPVIYRPEQAGTPIDPVNPVMLGVWHGTLVLAGLTWNATVQNNSNNTYHFEARAEDRGVCTYADQQWHCTSTITGRSDGGSYRVLSPGSIEIAGSGGVGIWQRR